VTTGAVTLSDSVVFVELKLNYQGVFSGYKTFALPFTLDAPVTGIYQLSVQQIGKRTQVLDSVQVEDGQTMAEYGVVLAVMTLAVLASMTLLSDNMRSAFESIAALLPG